MYLFTLLFLLWLSLFTVLSASAATVGIDFPDNRVIALTAFFDKHKCPQISYDLIPFYIQAATKYHLDYRLLAAISIQESSCGRHFRYRNLWGWNSARTGFKTFEEGVDFVSSQLTNGKHYRGKTLDQKLKAYNPNRAYPPKIKKLMSEMYAP